MKQLTDYQKEIIRKIKRMGVIKISHPKGIGKVIIK